MKRARRDRVRASALGVTPPQSLLPQALPVAMR
jgi:hypothetical protein